MNIYLVISETIYHTNEALKKIKKDITNVITFNMEDDTIDDVLAETSYFSMFDEKKCLIVKNAKLFETKNKEAKKNALDEEKLLNYIQNENKNTLLIFTTNNKVDTRKKIFKLINDNNHVINYPTLTRTEIKKELANILKEGNYRIDDKSLWYIINNSLGNFDLAYNELKKIMLYYNKPCNISFDDVVALTAKTVEENNFKLVDYIINKDLINSLNYLKELNLKNEQSVIISLLYREFKLMLCLILYKKKGLSQPEILKELKLAEWQYEKVNNNLHLYNIDEIKQEIVKLSDLDYKLKSGLIDKDIVLIWYVLDLCM